MHSLPLFLRVNGRKIVLIGSGDMAEAKARLWRRAGAVLVDEDAADDAAIAIIALDGDASDAAAERMRGKGLLINVVDRPDLCDFTTPAIVERDPVLIAIATGGASAGLAKSLRQRMEAMLPQNLGQLARALGDARDAIRARFPNAADRRRALDTALGEGGPLDPFTDCPADAVAAWLSNASEQARTGYYPFALYSDDPDDLTLRAARMLGQADEVWHDAACPPEIMSRARADAVRRIVGSDEPAPFPHQGIIVHLTRP